MPRTKKYGVWVVESVKVIQRAFLWKKIVGRGDDDC